MIDTSYTEHMIELVASARQELAEAQTIHAQDAAEVARLSDRINDCRDRQAAITGRRLSGKSTPEDAAEYAALSGDISVLDGLLADARATAAASSPERQRSALAHAESALKDAQAQAEFDLIVAHAREVEAAYVAALDRVWREARALGHKRTFGECYSIAEPIMAACRQNFWEVTQ